MMMKLKYISTVIIFLIITNSLFSQSCEIEGIASKGTITCGDCIELEAYGKAQGQSVFEEDFNSGSPQGWNFTQTVTISDNACGEPSPDGTDFMWMGDASVNPRDMETIDFDLSAATSSGVTICFEMRYSIQGQTSPCEGPDLADEGVYLQYSTDGGQTWVEIQYWDPNGGNDQSLVNWNQYCVNVDPAAITSSTRFRWHQTDVSGAEYDHWGIDNVEIFINDPDWTITWKGIDNGSDWSYPDATGGIATPQVCPKSTTNYIVEMVNNVDNTLICSNSVEVVVETPEITVTAGPDTTICIGECVDLEGNARVIISPGGEKNYGDNTPNPIIGAGTNLDVISPVGVNVNMTTVNPNSIKEICINGLNYSGQTAINICTSFSGCTCSDGSTVSAGGQCPQEDYDLSDFEFKLTTPDGCEITLVPVGGFALGTTDIANVCFTPDATSLASTGSGDYSGNWQPVDPISNLDGCDPNGNWELIATASTSGIVTGFGVSNGWTITLDDIEINEQVNYSWTPSAGLTNSTIANPGQVCPPSPGADYTLTGSLPNGPGEKYEGCTASDESDVASIITEACCDFKFNGTPSSSGCLDNDGSISLTPTGLQNSGTATITDIIENGSSITNSAIGSTISNGTSITISDLPSGTYTITFDDIACDGDTTITVDQITSSVFAQGIVVDETCSNANGTFTVASGIEILTTDGGAINGTSDQVTDLSQGNYNVRVRDITSGCEKDTSFSVANNDVPVNPNAVILPENCSGLGSITVDANLTVTNVSPSGTITNNIVSDLPEGTYTLTIETPEGCSVDSVYSVNSEGGLSFGVTPIDPSTCDGDGSIDITGLNGDYNITIYYEGTEDNKGTVTFSDPQNFGPYKAGIFDSIIISDGACADTVINITLSDPAPFTINSITSTKNYGCTIYTGSVDVQISGTTGNETITWTDSQGNTVANTNGLSGDTYTVTVVDGGCSAIETVTVEDSTGFVITVEGTSPEDCGVGNGSADLSIENNESDYTYEWTDLGGNVVGNELDLTNVSSGTYTLNVTQTATGCTNSETVVIGVNSDLNITDVITTNVGCDGTDGTIEVIVEGGTPGYTYSINGGNSQASNLFNVNSSGSYNITVTDLDGNGCSIDSIGIIVDVDPSPIADFTATPIVGDAPLDVDFTNNSTNYDVSDWIFGDNIGNSTEDNPSYTYNEAGSYVVTLTVTNLAGCTDQDTVIITVLGEEQICFPNVFTPNGDGINDEFKFPEDLAFGQEVYEEDYCFSVRGTITEFNCKIYNRWGNLVYELTDLTQSWKGINQSDTDVKEGIYYYMVEAKSDQGEEIKFSSTVTLNR